MGLLDSNCSSLFFQMKCDVYYAGEAQGKHGSIEKRWDFDSTLSCSFYTIGDKGNDNNFTFDDSRFYRLETMLYGRLKTDPRKSSSGLFYPLSHILLTNIRSGTCNDEVFFVETTGDYESVPTIYEIKTCQPYIGPFNTIEYYKIQLERSDTQELNSRVAC